MPINIGPGGRFYATGGAKTLPRNLIYNSGSLWEDFETAGNWTASGGSTAANTTQKVTGSQSMKVIASSTTGSTIFRDVTLQDLSYDWQQFRVDYYLHDALADYGTTIPYVRMHTTADGSNVRYCYLVTSAVNNTGGWHTITCPKPYWKTEAGSPNWNAIRRFSVRFYAATGKTPAVSWDNARIGIKCTPTIMLRFDDGYATQYTEGFGYMRRYGIRGTLYQISDWLDTAGGPARMTTPQMQEMQAAGWTIGNHTQNSADLTTEANQAAQEAQIANCASALAAKGAWGAQYYIAFPQGNWNADTLTSMSNLGMRTGHTTISCVGTGATPWRPVVLPQPYPYNEIGATNIDSAISLATATGYVDEAIAAGTCLSLIFHGIAGGSNWTPATFRAFIDYVYAKRAYITPITIDDYYRLSLGSVTVPEVY